MYFLMNIMNQAKDFDSPVFPKRFTEKMTEVLRNQGPVWWVGAFLENESRKEQWWQPWWISDLCGCKCVYIYTYIELCIYMYIT